MFNSHSWKSQIIRAHSCDEPFPLVTIFFQKMMRRFARAWLNLSMNPKLEHFIERYTELEREVQPLVNAQCTATCAQCTMVCCRADICEEAIESSFLKLIHKRKEMDSDAYGFLTPTGCGLEIGRPNVCYEYFCSDLFYKQPDTVHEKVLKVLGALPAHAGRNATGDTHLLELLQDEALEHLAFQRLEKNLDECFQALEIIKEFYTSGTLPDTADHVLDRITFSEEDYP